MLDLTKSRLQPNPPRKQVNAESLQAPVPPSGLRQVLQNAWLHKGWLARLLLPASWAYQLVAMARRGLYELGLYRTEKINATVLVVGNVIIGGAGKTPTVISIVRHLKSRGLHVGVISRGYGRNSRGTLLVTLEKSAHDVGDEPALIQRTTGVPVVVGVTRTAAARFLLERYPDTQVVVCDDGLQHYALHRDLEVCVFDNRGCGNGWQLPAGPLRESWPRRALACAGQNNATLLVLHTGTQPAFGGYRASRALALFGFQSDGTSIALDSLNSDTGPPLRAVAGIAQPEAFFDMLKASGVALSDTLALPDHYDFDSFLRISHEGYRLICTEKDANKLWQHCPDAVAVPLIQTAEPAFWQALDAALNPYLAAQLSFPHGHKTT